MVGTYQSVLRVNTLLYVDAVLLAVTLVRIFEIVFLAHAPTLKDSHRSKSIDHVTVSDRRSAHSFVFRLIAVRCSARLLIFCPITAASSPIHE